MSFSWEQRRAISKRAAGTDEVTGLPLKDGEAAHIDHSKDEHYFDVDENSLFVSTATHLWLHLIDEDNGLSKSQNDWAIKELKKRVKNLTPEEYYILGQWIKSR